MLETGRLLPVIARAAIVVAGLLPVPAMGRVLPPAATAALQQSLEAVWACQIDDMDVQPEQATVRLCLRTAPQSCFAIRLDDPQDGCDGERAGPWCLRWDTGEAPEAVRDAVRAALRTADDVWSTPGDRPSGAPEGGALRHLRLQPWALAGVLVVLPLLAGIGLARALRRWRWGWLWGVVALIAQTLIAIVLLPQVGVWDTVSVGTLLIVGLVFGAAHLDRRNAALLIGSFAIGLTGLELAARWYLPQPPRFPPPEDALFVLSPAAWDAGCSVLYGPAGVDDEIGLLRRASISPRKPGPLVVHLGDSMTFGDGVPKEATFPALLDARQPNVAHANYGVWAVGTDFEYLLLQKVLAERPAMVVLHVYVGNDIYDIDRPYACCDAGPLLDYAQGVPSARCPSARWRFPLALRLSRSPAPYPLRVASGWSYAAAHAVAAWSRLASRWEPRSDFIRAEGEGSERGWEHFTQILTKMRDDLRAQDIPLVVSLLPNRSALDARGPSLMASDRARRRIAAVTAQLGIQTLDAWDLFVDAVQRDGSAPYFRDPHDIHFTPEGHRLLADWLATQLPPLPQLGGGGTN